MIDAHLNEAARAGRFIGLTLYATPDGRWQASLTQDRVSWRVEIDADPAAALRRVLGEPVTVAGGTGGIFE